MSGLMWVNCYLVVGALVGEIAIYAFNHAKGDRITAGRYLVATLLWPLVFLANFLRRK